MRLLITAFLVYLLYRLWKSGENKRENDYAQSKKNTDSHIGEMVQDPICKVYIPMDQAYRKRIKGKDYFFCSKECAEIFVKKVKNEEEVV